MNRILFVSMHGEIAGAEKSLLLLVSHLSCKCKLKAACPVPSPLSSALNQVGCECFALPQPRRSRFRSLGGILHLILSSIRTGIVAFRVGADIVHANNLLSAAVSLPAVIFGRARLVWHARDVGPSATMSRLVGRFSSRVIAVSHWLRRHIIAQGVAPRKISVVYNAVEPPSPAAPRNAGTTPGKATMSPRVPFVFGNVGQFIPWKKQVLFLAAARRVTREVPHARFLLVGDDIFGRNTDYARSLRSHAKAGALSDRMSLTGWRTDMANVYAEMDCLVHTADAEPFGRVVIEAMSAGVPVIAVDSGGPSETVVNGSTGLLVAPDDVAAISKAMVRIATEPGLAAELSTRARKEVSDRFAPAEVARRVEQIYEEIIAEDCSGLSEL